MIYWQLFLSFLQIGALSFGGGYAAMPLLQEQLVARNGWLSVQEFADLVTIAEMTPGPIAVNTATYVGARVCGPDFVPAFMGSFIATLGVSLPSFIIVYFVARSLEKFSQSRLVKEALCGIRPAVIAFMITAVIFFLNITVFPIDNATSESSTFNPIGIPVLAVLFYLHYYRKVEAISLMLISGIIGVLVY